MENKNKIIVFVCIVTVLVALFLFVNNLFTNNSDDNINLNESKVDEINSSSSDFYVIETPLSCGDGICDLKEKGYNNCPEDCS